MVERTAGPWLGGMDEEPFKTWVQRGHRQFEEAWSSGSSDAVRAVTEGISVRNNRALATEDSYEGHDGFVRSTWGLRDFFPQVRLEVLDAVPPDRVVVRFTFSDDDGNEIVVFTAQRVETDGLAAELVACDSEAEAIDALDSLARD